MILVHEDDATGGIIRLIYEEDTFSKAFSPAKDETLTIIWNRGEDQAITIDNEAFAIEKDSVIVINSNQPFQFLNAQDFIIWQYNRDFYCIIDHDEEVSCAGLLFYGHRSIPMIKLAESDSLKLSNLFQVFLDEYDEASDNLKTEMLRVILKRLIVKLTRNYKSQVNLASLSSDKMDTIRQFNLLVEKNFRKHHQVQDYVDLIHKSSKTISNIFSQYSATSPLEVIHQRIFLEAKRLLIYTDLSAKEIGYDIGFGDIQSFSRFFKRHASSTPSEFRKKNKKNA